MSGLPRIYPVRWVNNGWGYQIVRMPSYGTQVKDPNPPNYTRWIPGIQRGYVKIWRNSKGQYRVVDRALSAKVARRRIKKLQAAALASEKPDAYGVTWHHHSEGDIP